MTFPHEKGGHRIILRPLWMLCLALGIAAGNPLPAQTSPPSTPDLNDHGTFELSAAGKTLGTETFGIRTRSGRIEAEGEGRLVVEQNGRKIEVRTSSSLVLNSQFDPVSYN